MSLRQRQNITYASFSKKKYKKMQKNLVMSKKSSTFARFFA